SFPSLSFGSGYTEIVAAGINTLRFRRKVQSRAGQQFRISSREVTFAPHSACRFGDICNLLRRRRPSSDTDECSEQPSHRDPQQYRERHEKSLATQERIQKV